MTYEDVKKLREKFGLTQTAMAEYYKIPVRTVSDWERGLRRPSGWVCELLCKALNSDFSER